MKKIVILFVLIGSLLFAAPLWADNTGSSSEISGKLDQVIATQQDILRQLADIKAELDVVKIRATNR